MVLLPVSKPFDNINRNNVKLKILTVLEVHDSPVNFLSLSFLREAIIFWVHCVIFKLKLSVLFFL